MPPEPSSLPAEEVPGHKRPAPDASIPFLHWAIEDTQNTIRFLDTKAAFCVTLLSGMVAVSLEHPLTSSLDRHVFFPIFIVVIAISLMIALRVIFPTFFPIGSGRPPATPKFFIGHDKGHHWIHHTIRNPRTNILSETPQSYIDSFHTAAGDDELLASMAETLVTISAIRQVKSDRLHSALYCLAAAIALFGAIMFTQNFSAH
jgi:hypothetical protein